MLFSSLIFLFLFSIIFCDSGTTNQQVESQLDAFKSISSENSQESVQNNQVENTFENVNSSKIAHDYKVVKRLPHIPTSPKPAPPRLWLQKRNLSDQVIITDVTVNKETVTIRECKKGFFLHH